MLTMRSAWPRLESLLQESAWARYAGAAFLVLATVFVRAVLDPVFSPSAYYHLYYPAVIVVAYVLGAGPAMFAIAMACASSLVLFTPSSPPASGWRSFLPLLSFVASSGVAVFVLSHVRGRMSALTREYNRVDALTQSQAELFRDHAERVSNHLQLISALLEAGARDRSRPDISRALAEASARTLLISRTHRALARLEGDRIDFHGFAERLAQAALDARNRPPLTVLIEGKLDVSLEHASSLGLILLDSINVCAQKRARGVLRVTLSQNRKDDVVFFAEEGPTDVEPARDATLLSAIAEQMRGRLTISANSDATTLQLAFPREIETSEAPQLTTVD